MLNELTQKAKDLIQGDLVLQAKLLKLYDTKSTVMCNYWIQNNHVKLHTIQACEIIKKETGLAQDKIYKKKTA